MQATLSATLHAIRLSTSPQYIQQYLGTDYMHEIHWKKLRQLTNVYRDSIFLSQLLSVLSFSAMLLSHRLPHSHSHPTRWRPKFQYQSPDLASWKPVRLPPGEGTPIYTALGCSSGNFKWTPKRYQSGCGLSRILPLKGTNQKHRHKQLVSMNLIAMKIKTYIKRCLNEMPFNWPWHP